MTLTATHLLVLKEIWQRYGMTEAPRALLDELNFAGFICLRGTWYLTPIGRAMIGLKPVQS